ncbi:hypothetical protein N7490_002183 [Penicillium lividum]|nr:hypothetical protein N7490_002183 [Penicillium lividum]
MATPSGIDIGNLTGKWIIQGFHWMLRKALGLAAVTLHMSLKGTHLEILQIPTGGLAQISETRILDDHESTILRDVLFGSRRSQNRLVQGIEGPHSRIVPDLVPRTPISEPKIRQFIRGEISLEGADGGFVTDGNGLWIHSFDEREDGTWTVEQVSSLPANLGIDG